MFFTNHKFLAQHIASNVNPDAGTAKILVAAAKMATEKNIDMYEAVKMSLPEESQSEDWYIYKEKNRVRFAKIVGIKYAGLRHQQVRKAS